MDTPVHKIGVLLDFPPSGGGTFQYNQSILDALAALPHAQFKIFVVYTSELWIEKLKAYDFSKIYVRKNFTGKALWKIWHLRRLSISVWRKILRRAIAVEKCLESLACDLWIFPSQDSMVYRFTGKGVATIHDLMHRYEGHFPENSENGEYERREYHYKNICRYAEAILVDSRMGAAHVIESYSVSENRIFVLPYTPPKYIFENAADLDLSKRKLPEKFIFYPSQFWEHKNHSRLLDAAKKLKTNGIPIHLVFSGSKNEIFEKLTKYARDLGLQDQVYFMGHISDLEMASFYKKARALMMPTFFGPTNIPPLEAFAIGCPVAVSKIYGMPEQLGDAALYFDPGSIDEISEIMRRLWTDDRLCKDLSERGKIKSTEWHQSHFNKKLCEILLSVLGTR
ncbi:MAG: mannosyltransferase [Bacteriovoracaceae bacterium]|nr:mannosyltransferase [Bacteriovoracaceae bacterium]